MENNGIQIYQKKLLNQKKNLPASVRLQQGAKAMYLNNPEAVLNTYNGTIGIHDETCTISTKHLR
jgi:hypothetical protein